MSSFLSLLFSILGLILMSGFMLIILVWSNDIWQFALLPICGTFCQIYCRGGGGLLGQGGELVPPAYARPQNLCFSQPIPPSATLLCTALLCQILPYTALLEIHRNTGFYSQTLPGCITLSSAQGFDGIVGSERELASAGGWQTCGSRSRPPHDNFRPIVSNFKFPPV